MALPTVAQAMTRYPITVTRDTPLADCARLLVRHGIRHLPVVDGERRLVGIIGDFDVLGRGALVGDFEHLWLAFDPGEEDLAAGDLCAPADVVARQDDRLASVLRRLAGTTQDIVVVLQDRRPIGIITEHDAVHLASNVLPEGPRAESQASSPVVGVDRHADARAGLSRMRQDHLRHLVVTDEGRLYGVLSFRDLVRDRVPEGARWEAQDAVRRIPPVAVDAQAPLKYAARLMWRQHIGCLPVVGEGAVPVGILTRTDLIRALAEHLESLSHRAPPRSG